jgi:RNA polymerase sigma factor (sigma-70 family)
MAVERGVEVAGASSQVVEPAMAREAPAAGLEKLVEENLGWLRGWLRGRLRDADAADDLCQEVFLKALQRLPSLRDRARFPAWLYRIAENALRDHLRAEGRRRARFVPTDRIEGLEVPAAERSPDGAEDAARVLEAIRGLPPKLREPLLLKHTRDLSYAEIGKILGIRENAVQVRIFRARRKLREDLKDIG